MSPDPGAPPFVVDAARVLRYAVLDMEKLRAGVVVNGVPLDAANLNGVAIAEALLDGTVFLLHCNDHWETVTASHHPDTASADAAATSTYGSAFPGWTEYRALSDEEQRELHTTRSFLIELAAEEFGG
jgi:hypothetical protein